MKKNIGNSSGTSIVLDPNSGLSASVKLNENSGSSELLINLEGHKCTQNTTNTPLLAGESFTGTGWQSTLDYGVISIDVVSDKDSAEDGLVVQWSYDGITISNTDSFSILADKPKTFTFGPANEYVRLVYTNGSEDQGLFSLQTLLRKVYVKSSSHKINDAIVGQDDAELIKAVLTGVNQDEIFVNIKASYAGSLLSSLVDPETESKSEIEPLGSLKTIIPVRLVGTTFTNGTKDPNFWTETVTGTGSVTQSGEVTLATGTTANSTAKYTTVRKARKITGTTNQFRAVARNIQTPADDCIRRIGTYNSTDGFFMQFDGTVFGVASRKNSVDTIVTNGNFNGNAGATIDFGGGTDFQRIVIDYTALGAKFFINGTLIHTISATNTNLTNTLTLPATIEIINENGNIINNSFEVLFATVLRLGELITNAQYYHLSGNAATHVLKYGAGVLQKIMFNNTSGTNVTIYDGIDITGNVIGVITTTSNAIGEWTYNVPFSDGLTFVTTGNSLDATIIYE